MAQRLAEEGPGGVLVVCGTGYIMPQARAFVGIDEPRYVCVSIHSFIYSFIVQVSSLIVFTSYDAVQFIIFIHYSFLCRDEIDLHRDGL